ncbi:transcriptional regulator [Streptomyces sp. MS1.HAVA.3]|uniref:Transcriptional regulator n=1 Tax=Streptomyces caledonius TaxID=3134107 RepID=A0ABU8UD17_9ACTN
MTTQAPAPHAFAAVSPLLTRLAAERATGALLRDRGTLFLEDGRIVHAESPATPGLDVLLTTGGGSAPERWREAVDRAGARRQVARFLVDSGGLAGGELEICHLAAIFDAAFFALSRAPGPPGSAAGPPTGSAPSAPFRPLPSSGRPSAAGNCSTRSGPTRCSTPPPWCRGRPPRPDGHRPAADPAGPGRRRAHPGGPRVGAGPARLPHPARRTAPRGGRTGRDAAHPTAATATPARLDGPGPIPDVALLRRLRDALEASL